MPEEHKISWLEQESMEARAQSISNRKDTPNGKPTTIGFDFSMQELRNSLSDENLLELLEKSFDPANRVTIKKIQLTPRFLEDDVIQPIKKSTQPKKVKIIPSEFFKDEINAYYDKTAPCNAKVVLGIYFFTYKMTFKEEDAAWVGRPLKEPELTISRFVHEVADGDYEKVIQFIENIIPLWASRLRKRESFPTSRPMINSLFGQNNRYFWSNRNNIYRQWAQ